MKNQAIYSRSGALYIIIEGGLVIFLIFIKDTFKIIIRQKYGIPKYIQLFFTLFKWSFLQHVMTKMMLIFFIHISKWFDQDFFQFSKFSRFIPVQSKRMKGQQETSAGLFVEPKIQVCIPFLFPNRNEKKTYGFIVLQLHNYILFIYNQN